MEYFEEGFFDEETCRSHLPPEGILPKGWKKDAKLLTKVLRGLGRIHATQDEIIAFLGITPSEWREFVDENPVMMSYYHRGESEGKIAIRRRQLQRAMNGSDVMLKHVGRHILGQHDKVTVNTGISLAERQALLAEVERRHEESLIDVTPEAQGDSEEPPHNTSDAISIAHDNANVIKRNDITLQDDSVDTLCRE